MKATTLAVSVPNYGCDKNCPYCISNMTGFVERDVDLFEKNLYKARLFAERTNVTDVVITGKGEPLLSENEEGFISMIVEGLGGFPIVLQTNGLWLKKERIRYDFMMENIDTIAFSLDTIRSIEDFEQEFHYWKGKGKTIRVVFNLVEDIYKRKPVDVLDRCIVAGVDQVTFRKITVPNWGLSDSAGETVKWIKDNIDVEKEDDFLSVLYIIFNSGGSVHPAIRRLPYGPMLYDYEGMSVVIFSYCLQDISTEDQIRSLIYQEDGHLYTHWQFKASRIF